MVAEPAPDPLKQLTDEQLLERLPRAAALPDPPADWVQRAVAAWQPPLGARLSEAAHGLRERVQALLKFDSWATAALAAGLRSTGSSATRQLVFSAEGRDVDLRIAPAEGPLFTLSGQVLGPDEAGAVMLQPEAAGASPQEASLDAFGEFHLPGVAPGRYRLSLLLSAQELVLPVFEVGGPAGQDGEPG